MSEVPQVGERVRARIFDDVLGVGIYDVEILEVRNRTILVEEVDSPDRDRFLITPEQIEKREK